MKNEECVFCKIIKEEIKSEVVKSSNNFIAIRDIHPKTEGHTLVIPKKHFVTLLDFSNNLGDELLHFLKEISSSLLENKMGDGFNIIMNNLEPAGQVIKHAHFHIIPRKEEDNFKLPI
ncbi:MAG: HIT domain-containing protein [Nanoarchaeota archaeon]